MTMHYCFCTSEHSVFLRRNNAPDSEESSNLTQETFSEGYDTCSETYFSIFQSNGHTVRPYPHSSVT